MEERLFERTRALYDQKKFNEALISIDSLIKVNKFNARYINFKGLCLYFLGRKREAVEPFDKAINLDQREPSYLSNKGSALVDLGEYDEAQKVIDLSLKINDKHVHGYFWKGKGLYLQSKYFQSLECLDKCLSLDPKHSDAHYYKGLSLKEMNCFEESIKEYEKAISINPNDADIYYQKSISLMKIKENDKAITEIDKAIIMKPDNLDFLNNKATCLINLNNLEAALVISNQILNRVKDNSEALKNKAQIYLKQNKQEEALDLINKGFRATPEFYELKGLILHKLNKADEAFDCLINTLNIKENLNNQIIKNMSSIVIGNYKNRSPNSELQILKDLNDKCMKVLTETNPKPIDPILHFFSTVNVPIDWEKIKLDQSSILNYHDPYENFFCKICNFLSKSSISCKGCRDVFCSECLKKALNVNNLCPNCRAKPFVEDKMDRIAKIFYDFIKINCPFLCGETLIMENLEKHLSQCHKREKEYECNLCKEKSKNDSEVDVHMVTCPEKMFQCQICFMNLKNKMAIEHNKTCLGRYVTCKDCLCIVPFKYQNSHIGYSCNILKTVRETSMEIQKRILQLEIVEKSK